MEHAFQLLCRLRRVPSAALLDQFLREIDADLVRLAQDSRDPPEVAQRTRIRVWRHFASCRARSAGQLWCWLRQIVQRQDDEVARLRWQPEPEQPEVADDRSPSPEACVISRDLAVAAQRAIEGSLGILPAELPQPQRDWARERRVAATTEGQKRDLEAFRAIRLRGEAVPEVARTLGMTESAAKKAAQRGEAFVVLSAWLAGLVKDSESGGNPNDRTWETNPVDLASIAVSAAVYAFLPPVTLWRCGTPIC